MNSKRQKHDFDLNKLKYSLATMAIKRTVTALIKLDLLLGLLFGYLIAIISFQTSKQIQALSPSEVRPTKHVARETSGVDKNRLLCWVVTLPERKNRAHNIKKTWGRRCDTLLFMSSKPDDSLPAVVLEVQESRQSLWRKATLTLTYIYENYLNDHEWFFKADDDTYALIDNMREYLTTLNSSLPFFLGHEFPYDIRPNITFLSGGAGYVLSRETLRLLVEQGLKHDLCPHRSFQGVEDDVTITECLKKVGALIPDTRDSVGNHRFLSCNVVQSFNNKVGIYDCKSSNNNRNCLSARPFTFHYVLDTEILAYEYLLYEAKTTEI